MSFSIIGPTAASLVSYHMPCTLIEICGKVMYSLLKFLYFNSIKKSGSRFPDFLKREMLFLKIQIPTGTDIQD